MRAVAKGRTTGQTGKKEKIRKSGECWQTGKYERKNQKQNRI